MKVPLIIFVYQRIFLDMTYAGETGRLVNSHNLEQISFGNLWLTIKRTQDGIINSVQPSGFGDPRGFEITDDGFIYRTEKGVIHLEKNPPEGLSRRKSGWGDIPLERRFWVASIHTRSGKVTTTIPVKKGQGEAVYSFTA